MAAISNTDVATKIAISISDLDNKCMNTLVNPVNNELRKGNRVRGMLDNNPRITSQHLHGIKQIRQGNSEGQYQSNFSNNPYIGCPSYPVLLRRFTWRVNDELSSSRIICCNCLNAPNLSSIRRNNVHQLWIDFKGA